MSKIYPLVVGVALVSAAVQTFAAQTALVVQDGAMLRAAARDSSPQQAQLARGEALEIRAERLDYWQVWDYRRERGGFVRKSQAMVLASDAPTLLAQLRLTMPQEGNEGLGVALAAAYVQAATPAELASATGAEVLDDLGQLGARIAANGTTRRSSLLDVASRYGLRFDNFEQADGNVRVCYDGDAFRRVLSLPATAGAKARAALALTRAECRPTTLTPTQAKANDDWRAEVLSHAPLEGLSTLEKNRLLLRRAGIAATRAFEHRDAALAQTALADFAQVEPVELAEDDMPDYNDAAMRVNAMRWLAQAQPAERSFAQGYLRMTSNDGATAGEHCLVLADTKKELFRRCSFGAIALASASMNREGNAIAVAVQPLDGWRELWVLRASKAGWDLQVLPPAAAAPGLGYAEFAGWVPGGKQLLVVSESRAEGRYMSRRFSQLALDTLAVQHMAPDPTQLGVFQRWADPGWKGASLALR
ncbi:MAG TPA: hypothetical protein VGM81_02850 [Burkholderiaceae bacterium]|jgi:hypothetical protein